MIVPLLNEESRVPYMIDMARRLGADEWLWVDGGSTDATRDLLAASGSNWLTAPCGRAAQMNAGAASATSDVLLFLHADTEFTASHLDAVREVMRNPNVVGGRFDVRLSGSRRVFRIIESFINLRSRLTRISTGDQAMFVRRAVFEAMGGFADIALMEDVEFSRRLKRTGSIACLSKSVTTSSRRWERHGIGRTVWLMWKLRLLFWLGTSPDKLAVMYRDAR